jgi:hypothetical protein
MGVRPVPEQIPITRTYYANLTQYSLGKGARRCGLRRAPGH